MRRFLRWKISAMPTMPIRRTSKPVTVVMACFVMTAIASLTGCAVAPAPHAALAATVQSMAPKDWSVEASGSDSGDMALDAWWQVFGDATMHRLIETVLTHNLNVQAALESVKQAEAIEVERGAILLPEVDAQAHAADARQITPPPLGYVRQAGAGLSANWSPDVFGGERLSVLAAQAQVSGRRDLLDVVRLGLAANTASAYIDLRWAQNTLQIEQDNMGTRRRTLLLTKERLHYGLSTQLDVARAQNQLDSLLAKIPRAQSQIQHQLTLIAVYSGQTPEDFNATLLSRTAPIPAPAQALPETLPSTALLRRPDVKAAYATVEQRAAEVGESEAQRYPQFRLSLTDGLLAASWVGLPTLTDNLFSAALSATSPIFNAGRITAQIGQSQSKLTEAQLGLRQAILQALKEIEDTRSDVVTLSEQQLSLANALSASDQAVQLSNRLYARGASSFLDVLSAQDIALQDALAVASARRDHALATVALYRSLGGGWQKNQLDM